MEFLFEILWELLLQILFQVIADIGAECLKDTFAKSKSPILSMIGFFLWGSLAGLISLWPFPHSFIASHIMRFLNLAVTPLIAGGFMALIGKYKQGHGRTLVALDKFSYAVVFAFAMALIRYDFAK
jgi:hypothetical protein